MERPDRDGVLAHRAADLLADGAPRTMAAIAAALGLRPPADEYEQEDLEFVLGLDDDRYAYRGEAEDYLDLRVLLAGRTFTHDPGSLEGCLSGISVGGAYQARTRDRRSGRRRESAVPHGAARAASRAAPEDVGAEADRGTSDLRRRRCRGADRQRVAGPPSRARRRPRRALASCAARGVRREPKRTLRGRRSRRGGRGVPGRRVHRSARRRAGRVAAPFADALLARGGPGAQFLGSAPTTCWARRPRRSGAWSVPWKPTRTSRRRSRSLRRSDAASGQSNSLPRPRHSHARPRVARGRRSAHAHGLGELTPLAERLASPRRLRPRRRAQLIEHVGGAAAAAPRSLAGVRGARSRALTIPLRAGVAPRPDRRRPGMPPARLRARGVDCGTASRRLLRGRRRRIRRTAEGVRLDGVRARTPGRGAGRVRGLAASPATIPTEFSDLSGD